MSPEKPALVLLHGVTSSGRAWDDLLPALSRNHTVYAPHALGHRGGERIQHWPTTLTDVIDSAERNLDQCGLDRPHLAGHSLGGYIAIELARRGRAASVSAFSPAGFWPPGDQITVDIVHGVKRSARVARLGGPLVKGAVSSLVGRRFMMGPAMRHPERMTAAQARSVIADHAGCTLADALNIADHEYVALLDPLPCPITVAWAAEDEILPLAKYEAAVRDRLPRATFFVLPGVGHAAMVDDPELVIQTILTAAKPAR